MQKRAPGSLLRQMLFVEKPIFELSAQARDESEWFHTFRHTYTTLLTQNNEEVKVVQELLRHANSRITLDLYAQAGMPNKRLAQSKLVRMVLNKGEALA